MIGALGDAGFTLSNELDLHTEHSTGKEYQHGTVAHRLYEARRVPTTRFLLDDLRLLLEACDAIGPAQLAAGTGSGWHGADQRRDGQF